MVKREPCDSKSVWINSAWKWDNGRQTYIWEEGHCEKIRPGYVYRQGYWRWVGNGWIWESGHWERLKADPASNR
ncbi:MAG: YXWGXW repeat-containing protein [Bacteroidia bacterium]|nr:YXWGXW repeat-containing protein [Bacteroidia bacterium]